MGPLLQGLIKLQTVENRLRAVTTKLARCRRSVIFQENVLRNSQSSLSAKEEEIKLTKLQLDRNELELKSRDEHIDKFRAALNLAKSNKEYSAILTELNTSKADNTKIETQIFGFMSAIDADQAECAEIEKQIEEQKIKVEAVRKESEGSSVKLEAEVKAIQVDWDAAAEGISRESLDIFKRVAETYDGEAMAYAEKQEARSGTFSCSGCFMRVPDEIVNILITKDDMLRCSNCTRILALRDDLEF
jgi:predicted  nucleic acid-binding Zn-ribbon protein